MLDRPKGKGQTKSDPPAPRVGGWGLGGGLKKSFVTGTATEHTKTTGYNWLPELSEDTVVKAGR